MFPTVNVLYMCVIYIHQHTLRHTPGLKVPLSIASVAYSNIYIYTKMVTLCAKHFGNTFINIVGFPVYVDIRVMLYPLCRLEYPNNVYKKDKLKRYV